MVGQKRVEEAAQMFRQSLSLAGGLDKQDAANRALAVTGNNLACELEERSLRTAFRPSGRSFSLGKTRISFDE